MTLPAAPVQPDVILDPVQIARVELALLLAQAAGSWDGTTPAQSADVDLRLTADSALAARNAGGAVLRDHESTPVARLSLSGAGFPERPEPLRDAGGDSGRLRGSVMPMRSRESSTMSAPGLRASDLQSSGGSRALVVIARPLTLEDLGPLREAAREQEMLVVVSDVASRHGPPPEVLTQAARAFFDDAALGTRMVLRTGPLALDDGPGGAADVEALARVARIGKVVVVGSTDPTAGATAWTAAAAALDEGVPGPLPTLSPPVERVLRRWRPLRSRRGLVLLFTGLSGSGKSTLARDLAGWLQEHSERTTTLLDGDVVRQMLSAGLGFDKASRELNVARIGFVAATVAAHGGIAICAPIAPYATTRARVRAMAEAAGDFILVHVCTPLAECERRDLKGLYAKARAGQIHEFTGISDPYEPPQDANLRIDTSTTSREDALKIMTTYLAEGGWLMPPPRDAR